MAAEDQKQNVKLDGTLQLPDGRQLPITVTVSKNELALSGASPARMLELRAVEVFGKSEKALSWLSSSNMEFGGKTPLVEAESAEGRERVLGVLFDLEHGFPA